MKKNQLKFQLSARDYEKVNLPSSNISLNNFFLITKDTRITQFTTQKYFSWEHNRTSEVGSMKLSHVSLQVAI